MHTFLCLGGGGKRDRYIDELSNLAGQETKEEPRCNRRAKDERRDVARIGTERICNYQ